MEELSKRLFARENSGSHDVARENKWGEPVDKIIVTPPFFFVAQQGRMGEKGLVKFAANLLAGNTGCRSHSGALRSNPS